MKIDNLNIQAEKKRDIFKKKKILITILYKWFKYNRVVYWTFVYFYLFIFFYFISSCFFTHWFGRKMPTESEITP